jgi:hypothetical protein
LHPRIIHLRIRGSVLTAIRQSRPLPPPQAQQIIYRLHGPERAVVPVPHMHTTYTAFRLSHHMLIPHSGWCTSISIPHRRVVDLISRVAVSQKFVPLFHPCKMYFRTLTPLSAAAAIVTFLADVARGGPTTPHDIFSRTPAAGIDVKSLSPHLSPVAKIYLQGSNEFTNCTVRWSNLQPPTPNIVIAPGTEKDVAQIVSSPY